jgi:Ca2+-binding RTX toxin-like protein
LSTLSGAAGAVSINSLSGNVDIGYSGNVSRFGAATFLGVESFHISSGAANDIITTGGGDDIINAGDGDDAMTGGEGSDTFVFQAGSGHDTITDFNYLDGDRLDIDPSAFETIINSNSVILSDGGDNSITLLGVDISATDMSDSAVVDFFS